MKPKECEHAIDIYLESLASAKKSVQTEKAYRQTMEKFRDFLKVKYSDEEEKEITELVPVAFRGYLNEQKLSTNSISQHLTRLHKFFRWCKDHNLIETNVVNSSDIPHLEEITYNLLTLDEMKKLLRTKPKGSSRHEIKRYAITVTLASTGLRNSELRGLCPADLDFENSIITVRKETAKGGKSRTAPFPKPAQEAIKMYLSCGIRPDTLGDDKPLFGSFADDEGQGRTIRDEQRWRAFNGQSINKMVKRYVNSFFGRDLDIHAHTLRHMAASYWDDLGVNIRDVQLSLGHSNIAITEKVYTHVLNKTKHAANIAAAFDKTE